MFVDVSQLQLILVLRLELAGVAVRVCQVDIHFGTRDWLLKFVSEDDNLPLAVAAALFEAAWLNLHLHRSSSQQFWGIVVLRPEQQQCG